MDISIAKITDTSQEIVRKIDELNDRAWSVHITQPNVGLELSNKAK